MSTKNGDGIAPTAKGRAAKERIYFSAIRLIQSGGYESMTVPAICESSGVSVGAFYHHFDSKGDILLRYVRDESDRLLGLYRSMEGLSRRDALLGTVAAFFGFFDVKGRAFVSAFLGLLFSSGGTFYDPGAFSIAAILENGLRRGFERGEFGISAVDSVPLARGIVLDLMVSWCVAADSVVAAADSLPSIARDRMSAFLDMLRP